MHYNSSYSKSEYTLPERFAFYVQKAVSQGAFLPFNTLFDRFQKAVNISVRRRQRERYREHLKTLLSLYDLKYFKINTCSGPVAYLTSARFSHFNPYFERITQLANPLLEKLHRAPEASIEVYDFLKKSLKQCRATLEKIVQQFKQKAKTLNLHFFKIGRTLYAKLRYNSKPKSFMSSSDPKSKPDENTPKHTAAPFYIKAKDEEFLNTNTAKAALRLKKTILGKAFWFSRKRLIPLFYDNCKVKLCFPMLIKFTIWAFSEGYEENIIYGCFSRALTQRHQDATDMAFNKNLRGYLFEMSSTVSLAKTYLLQSPSPPSFKERWHYLKTKIFPKKPKIEKKQIASNEKESKAVNFLINGKLSLELIDAALSKIDHENVDDFHEPTKEEQIVTILQEYGYRNELIVMFNKYLNNQLRKDLQATFQEIIDKMLKLVSEKQITINDLPKPVKLIIS